MFLPKGIYERAPYYWIILGVFLIIMGVYLGVTSDSTYSIAGMGIGAISCIWGLLVFQRRLEREVRHPCSTYDEYLDQTCELNVKSGTLGAPGSAASQE